MSQNPDPSPVPEAVVDQRVVGQILVVTIRREAKRNAIDAQTTAGIDAALDRLEDDETLRVGILTGGPSMFSAGTDLLRTAGPPTPRGGEYGIIRRKRRKPLIAAVEGFALGGGMEIVLACDLVCASRGTRFGLPEVQKALVPTCGGLFRPVRALPLNIARELMLTGDPLEAEQGPCARVRQSSDRAGRHARRGARAGRADRPQWARRDRPEPRRDADADECFRRHGLGADRRGDGDDHAQRGCSRRSQRIRRETRAALEREMSARAA